MTSVSPMAPPKVVRLVLAEDNLLVREGLVSLLRTCDEVELVGTCASLPELLAAVEEHNPDVVLTDIRMPPSHSDEGVRAAETLRQTHPELGVVVISQFAEPEYVIAVLGEGSRGRGYVVKDRVDDLDHLLGAIRSVASGGSFIDDTVVDVLIQARARVIDSPLQTLSPRELDVLAEIAAGRSNTAVAESLHVSRHAVEKHTNAIFAKLGLTEDDEINRRVKAVLLFLAGKG
ncbi:MAG: DNA-binding NarL/FixJ family response regulator [Candidatus Aldehydirespiratoraceae bacterium]|jgi:DNA-binding NarL/FixJ family response regulator